MNLRLLFGCFALCIAPRCFGLPPSFNPSVYWDRSHTADFEFNGPNGRYSELANQLTTQGYVNSSGTASLTSIDLSAFDILVYGDAMVAFAPITDDELTTIRDFVYEGGGLLLMPDIKNSGGYTEMQKLAGLFEAEIGVQPFMATEIHSTLISPHPSVRDVDSIFFLHSSTFKPGMLTPTAFHFNQPMIAAGEYGQGRVVLIADSDALANVRGDFYINRADNRQLATSIFRYLAVPEPSVHAIVAGTLAAIAVTRRFAGGRARTRCFRITG